MIDQVVFGQVIYPHLTGDHAARGVPLLLSLKQLDRRNVPCYSLDFWRIEQSFTASLGKMFSQKLSIVRVVSCLYSG